MLYGGTFLKPKYVVCVGVGGSYATRDGTPGLLHRWQVL